MDARYIDPLADLLEESVLRGLAPDLFRQRLLHTFPLTDTPADDDEVDLAVRLYEQLLDLERQGINGIWARIIKNAFAPLFQGRFDYVAGNPPWVNWESLPGGLPSGDCAALAGPQPVHCTRGSTPFWASAKDDISVLLTYVALDKYLKEDGRLGFVITQSVFKTAGGGQGFRRFQLGDGTPIGVVAVDDMVDLQPFEGASNRTAVVILQRGRKTRYPVPYNLWRKTATGQRVSRRCLAGRSPAHVRRASVRGPAGGCEGSHLFLDHGAATGASGSQQAAGRVGLLGRAGVCTWLNGVYWLEVVAQRPDGLLVVQQSD